MNNLNFVPPKYIGKLYSVTHPFVLFIYLNPRSIQVFLKDGEIHKHSWDSEIFRSWLKCTSDGRPDLKLGAANDPPRPYKEVQFETLLTHEFEKFREFAKEKLGLSKL